VSEWSFKVIKRKKGVRASLLIQQIGSPPLVLSEKELEDLYYARTDFARYPRIPRRLYKKVYLLVCEALGYPFNPSLYLKTVPEKWERVRIKIPPKPLWEKAESFIKYQKERVDRIWKLLEDLEYFREVAKKWEKKKKK